MRLRQATSVSTLAWLPRWPSSLSQVGRTASSAICTPRAVTPSSSTRKRKSWLSAGPENGLASSNGGQVVTFVGAGVEWSGVGTLASPMGGRREVGAKRQGNRTQGDPMVSTHLPCSLHKIPTLERTLFANVT